ncbi:ArdC family protein [Terricaulis silvestris]|uniref:DNA primase TraC n=1 Tax=Terricaulis silvestris TaxID=2686094 RepID=A0A6I6MPY4_9CAUL|nr:ArdC-like ssDNA-binding domain-containing protein [Terricaulis silvestris]QGZ94904.1 DNA primase TraC [Terricaulis silvestris]
MTRSFKPHSPRRSAQDALAHVTAEIVRLLDEGVMPWRAPWDAKLAMAATPGLPLRHTGEPYRGANVVLLWAAQMARGYSKRTWLTYRQAAQLGGQVRKGEKACPVIYYGQAIAKNEKRPAMGDDGEPARGYRFVKLFLVFNCEQIDDLPPHIGVEITPEPQAPDALDAWIGRLGAKIIVGGASAHYAPVTDTIHMPPRVSFLSDEHERATKYHELAHWTGHTSRLDRLGDYFTDRKAKFHEELVAELASATLGAMIGLAPSHLEDHAAYISDWAKLVRESPRAFLSAGAKAQAAVDWLIAHAGHPAGPSLTAHTSEAEVEALTSYQASGGVHASV